MIFTLQAPEQFNLRSTIVSHGWHALPPFSSDDDRSSLRLCVPRNSGKPLLVEISQPAKGALAVSSGVTLRGEERKELEAMIASSLRLHEDFSEFYREARRLPECRWIVRSGAGRLLRAPTAFEDVLKMMCTTNCSWALTEIIVKNLCRCFGEQGEEGWHTFPSAEAIAASSEKFLRNKIRAGYRAPYILEFSRQVAQRNIDPEGWRSSTLPTDCLYDEVRAVRGIGPYAAGNILKLLGRYDYLGIDSWCRKQFFALHTNGRTRGDAVIEKRYVSHGKWRGLFFWLEMTKEWYDE